jgi:cytochrome c oxidase subunit 1
MPRRYAAYPPEFQVLNVLSTAGASILGTAFFIPMIYLTYAWFWGPKAGNNPWQAKGLEWEIQSPPTTYNFDVTPTVTEEAYNYGPWEENKVA